MGTPTWPPLDGAAAVTSKEYKEEAREVLSSDDKVVAVMVVIFVCT